MEKLLEVADRPTDRNDDGDAATDDGNTEGIVLRQS